MSANSFDGDGDLLHDASSNQLFPNQDFFNNLDFQRFPESIETHQNIFQGVGLADNSDPYAHHQVFGCAQNPLLSEPIGELQNASQQWAPSDDIALSGNHHHHAAVHPQRMQPSDHFFSRPSRGESTSANCDVNQQSGASAQLPLLDTLVQAFQSMSKDQKSIKNRTKGPGWFQLSNKIVRFAVETLVPKGEAQGNTFQKVHTIFRKYAIILHKLGLTVRPCSSDDMLEKITKLVGNRCRKGASKEFSEDDQMVAAGYLNQTIRGLDNTFVPTLLTPEDLKGRAREELKEILESSYARNKMINVLENIILISLRESPPVSAIRRSSSSSPETRRKKVPRTVQSRPLCETTPVNRYTDFLKDSIISQLDFLQTAVEQKIRHTGIAEGLKITIECFEKAQQTSNVPSDFCPEYPSREFKDMIIYLIGELKLSVHQYPGRIGSFKGTLFPLLAVFEQFCELCYKRHALKYMTVCRPCSQNQGMGVSSSSDNNSWGEDGSSEQNSDDSDHPSGGTGSDRDDPSSGAGSGSGGTGPTFSHGGSTKQNAASNNDAVSFAVHLEDGKSRFEIKHDSALDGFIVVHKRDAGEDPSIATAAQTISALPDVVSSAINQSEQHESSCSLSNTPDDYEIIPLQNRLKNMKVDDSAHDKKDKPDEKTPLPQAVEPTNDTKTPGRRGQSSSLDDSKQDYKGKNYFVSAKHSYELKKRQKSDQGSIASCLISNMQQSRNEVELQLFYLSEIWSMSKDNKTMRKTLMSTTVTSEILHTMMTHPSSNRIQETACATIYSLSSDSESRIEIARAGLVDCVLNATLKVHKNDAYIAEAGIAALRLLSREPAACEKMKEWNAVEPICEGMRIHQTIQKVQTDGCYLLSNLAISCEDGKNNTVHKAHQYELRAIVTALELYKDSQEDVTLAACFALKSYTWRKENLELLATSYHHILDLLQTMATTHVKCKDNLDKVIQRLKRYHARQNEEHEIESASTVTHILEIMQKKSDSKRIFLCCLQSMICLASENGTAIEPTTERHIAELVITGLKTTFRSYINVSIECCRLLNLMIVRNTTFRRVIIEAGGCTVLAETFRQHRKNIEVKIHVSMILKELSIERACWSEFEETSVNGANGIVEEMMTTSPSDAQIEENALVILNNFMKHMPS